MSAYTELLARLEADGYDSSRARRIVGRLMVDQLEHIPGTAEIDDDEFPLPGEEPPDPPDEE
jgi:hypothetical protein